MPVGVKKIIHELVVPELREIKAEMKNVQTEIKRLDEKIELQGARLEDKIDAQGAKLDGKIDSLHNEVGSEFRCLNEKMDLTLEFQNGL